MVIDPVLVADIYRQFPLLASTPHSFLSPCDQSYNCIAWSAGDDTRWWWPSAQSYWPAGVQVDDSLDAFIDMYGTLGFTVATHIPRAGRDAIAIYGEAKRVKHAARRARASQQWLSKLGAAYDIEHTLKAVESQTYGSLLAIVERN